MKAVVKATNEHVNVVIGSCSPYTGEFVYYEINSERHWKECELKFEDI